MPLVTAVIRGDDLLRWTVASAAAAAAMVLVAVAFRRTLLPTSPRASSPAIALVAYVSCGLARDLVLTVSTGWVGISVPSRITGLMALTVAYMILAALEASHAADTRRALGELQGERHHLDVLVATFDERVAQADREIATHVRRELDPAIRDIEDLLRKESADEVSLQETTHLLTRTVTELVRPMSRRLMDEAEESASGQSLVKASITAPSPAQGLWRHRVDTPAAIRPLLTTLLMVILIRVPRSVTQEGLDVGQLAAIAIVIFVAPGLILAAIRQWWPSHLRLLPLPGSIAALVLVFAVAAGTPIIVARAFGDASQLPFLAMTGRLSLPPTLVIEVVIGMAVSLMTISNRRLARAEAELREVNQLLTVTVSGLRRRLWTHRRNLSWILHGPIQSALISAALALSSAGARVDREEVRRRIEESVHSLETSQSAHRSLAFALAETASVWSFSCAIDVVADPGVTASLEDDPSTSLALAEIIREAVSNAIRHGGATTIMITIDDAGSQLVRVRIIDNGHGPSSGATPGLGSQMLDEITYAWDLTATAHGTTLTADVALR